jgi:SAM-dependent methyltransferase
MIKMLKSAHCHATFFGIDLWRPQRYDKNYIALVGDARNLPFNNDSFDVVYSLGVVEHFAETSRAICEHARIVKKDGYVVITVPRLSFYTIPRFIVYWMQGKNEGTFTEVIGKNLTISFMKRCFEQAGLTIIKASAAGFNAPKISGFWETHIHPYLPERIFGAYLFCIGQKVAL